MNLSSPTPQERARKYLTLALRELQSAGQRPIAERLSVSESTISRHISEGQLERSIRMLAELGLKVVPAEMKCFNPKDIDAILHQAKCWLAHVESSEQLWEQE